MQRARKISAGPDLQSIHENEQAIEIFDDNDVFKPSDPVENKRPPPQSPGQGSDMNDRLQYVNNAITWLKEELRELKQQDKDLMNAYKHLIVTVGVLKKMNNTFQEQSRVLEKMNSKEEESALLDLPQSSISEQRYKRIGKLERHCSYS